VGSLSLFTLYEERYMLNRMTVLQLDREHEDTSRSRIITPADKQQQQSFKRSTTRTRSRTPTLLTVLGESWDMLSSSDHNNSDSTEDDNGVVTLNPLLQMFLGIDCLPLVNNGTSTAAKNCTESTRQNNKQKDQLPPQKTSDNHLLSSIPPTDETYNVPLSVEIQTTEAPSLLGCATNADDTGFITANQSPIMVTSSTEKNMGKKKKNKTVKRLKAAARSVFYPSSSMSAKKKSSGGSLSSSLRSKEYSSSSNNNTYSKVRKGLRKAKEHFSVDATQVEFPISPLPSMEDEQWATTTALDNERPQQQQQQEEEQLLLAQAQQQEAVVLKMQQDIQTYQQQLSKSISIYQQELLRLQETQQQLERVALNASPSLPPLPPRPHQQPAANLSNSDDGVDLKHSKHKELKRSESGSFMRVHDLDLNNNTIHSKPEEDCSLSSLSQSGHSAKLKINNRNEVPEFLFMDHYLKEIVEQLVQVGFDLVTDEGSRFTPTRETARLIAGIPAWAHDSKNQNGWPVQPWIPAYDDHIFVWTGKVSHTGFGHTWPIVKGRAIMHTSSKGVLEYLWDSTLVPSYSALCQGREDVYTWQDNVDMTAEESPYGIAGCAKIVKSLNKHRLLPKGIEMKSLLYALPLKQHSGSYMLVSRSVWESPAAVLPENNAKDVVRTEMLMGCTILRALNDTTCEMTQITHVHLPGVPQLLASRGAPGQYTASIRELRDLCLARKKEGKKNNKSSEIDSMI